MTTIGDFIRSRQVYSVQRKTSVFEAVQYMAKKNVGALAVLDDTRLVGIFSERDVVTRVVAEELDPKTISVEEVMTSELVVAEEGESEESCLRKMKSANCRHLPVVSGDTLVGMVSLRDLLQVEITARDEKLEYLTSYLFYVHPSGKEDTKR